MYTVKQAGKYYQVVSDMYKKLAAKGLTFSITSEVNGDGFKYRSVVAVETSLKLFNKDIVGSKGEPYLDGNFYIVQRIYNGDGDLVVDAPLMCVDRLFLVQLLMARKGVKFEGVQKCDLMAAFLEVWQSCAPNVLGLLQGIVAENDLVISFSGSGGMSIPLLTRNTQWSSELLPSSLPLMTLVHYISKSDPIVARLQSECVEPSVDINTYLWGWSQLSEYQSLKSA